MEGHKRGAKQTKRLIPIFGVTQIEPFIPETLLSFSHKTAKGGYPTKQNPQKDYKFLTQGKGLNTK